ncbi:Rad4-domain-containing protein [Pseudovirgaria hyperparasitica]|uniref:Rad4-domain-containing protein n=1 Tax=Pseudovirgaria hyperparasitica TaxID=470096 RepID=A0A6A6WLH5_9PEZI|nr:Rad4-domain-containing protein [Pseudovirgaria hyperparasitica]KAF2763070.1 Rad4-domain-containing protein [Pseudovirgaria hyperparasitica]
MPPYVSRKRSRSPALPVVPPRKRIATKSKYVRGSNKKKDVFHALDELSKPAKRSRTLEENQKFLDAQEESDAQSRSDASSSDDSDEFEDVLQDADTPATAKSRCTQSGSSTAEESEDDNEQDDDDAVSTGSTNWHDLLPNTNTNHTAPIPSGDLQITLPKANEQPDYSHWAAARETTGKKGPSKIERQIRVRTHCMHVQFLLYHNLVRNSWIQDKEVQKLLLDKLSEGCWKEICIWREAVGLPHLGKDEHGTAGKAARKMSRTDLKKAQGKFKGKEKGKDKPKKDDPRSQRDWSNTATRDPDNSPHDGLPRLLQYLLSFWRKIFKPTAPSLKKVGYLESSALQAHMRAYKKDNKDVERFGERITTREEFRECARKTTGSRDVGQQLFTGLLRAVGIEARMVCSLQPVGFGWSKAEDGKMKKPAQTAYNISAAEVVSKGVESTRSKTSARKSKGGNKGSKTAPIDLDSDSSSLSDPPSDSGSDLSIVDLTPSKSATPARRGYPHTHPYPTYWTEAFSPVTNRPHAASPLTAPHIASTAEAFQAFEPRGKDADKAKQVFAYIVAYSYDGTAKDVTVRYLKRHMWPGKTKGVRLPVEKIPVYNKHGKIKRCEEYDWFKNVLSAYRRDAHLRTQADEIEDTIDLIPVKPNKKDKEENLDTLTGLKASADYVLERFMRREEALLPTAKPVRNFTSGKGDKAKTEPVYRRADVVSCKTVESWHKEGREIIPGAQALKRVPHRAVTIARKQEIIDHERETGEKPLQGLYSKAQTQYIIPPPIEDGRIPRNAFGNIDVYVPSMVPKGASHIPLRGTMRICKKLGIDFAEACVGFEFGAQRAVPVIHGVVVAEGHRKLVRDAWHEEQVRLKEKEEKKREARALALWKKFLTGMRIIERVRAEYGTGVGESADINPFVHKKASIKQHADIARAYEDCGFQAHDEEQGGGFIMPGHEEEEMVPRVAANTAIVTDGGGGFLPDADRASGSEGGGFMLEEEVVKSRSVTPDTSSHDLVRTPMSLQIAHQQSQGSAKGLSVNARMNKRRRIAEDNDTVPMPSSPEVPTNNKNEDEFKPETSSRKGRAKVPSTTPSKQERQPARVVPKRQAAKRASAGTGSKSKYFEGSDESDA